jgi:hypothetical protein
MLRVLLTLASILSLLLSLAICTLWLRSFTLSDQLFWNVRDGRFWSFSAPGTFVLGRWRASPRDQPLPTEPHALRYRRDSIGWAGNHFLFMNGEPGDIDTSHEFAGFAWYEKRNPNGRLYWQFVIPFWFLATVTALIPLIWITLHLRRRLNTRRRKSQGLCPHCGYDLRVQLAMNERSDSNGRASPTRCPECGAAPIQ